MAEKHLGLRNLAVDSPNDVNGILNLLARRIGKEIDDVSCEVRSGEIQNRGPDMLSVSLVGRDVETSDGFLEETKEFQKKLLGDEGAKP